MLEQPGFGRRVKALRVERGLSQSDLAGTALSTSYLSRIESGRRPPTARVVEHLAKELGVTPAAFEEPRTRSLGRVLATVTSGAELAAASTVPGAWVRGSRSGAVEQVAAALKVGDDRWDPALRWQALWFLSHVDSGRVDGPEEHVLLKELNAVAEELDAPELRARARTRLARSSRIAGDYLAAREHALAAVSIAETLDVPDRAAALQELVSAETEAGRLSEARGHVDELCETTRGVGGSLYASALWSAATVRVRQADYNSARDLLEQALGLVGHEDPLLWLRVHLAAGSLYVQVRPPAVTEARECLEKVAPVAQSIGSDVHRQQLLAVQAHLAFGTGALEEARTLCRRFLEQPPLLSFRDRVRLHALSHQLDIKDGRTDEGVHGMQALAQQAQESMNPELAAEVWRALAEALAAGHDPAP